MSYCLLLGDGYFVESFNGFFVDLLKRLLILFLCVCVIYQFKCNLVSLSLGAKVCFDLSLYYIIHKNGL